MLCSMGCCAEGTRGPQENLRRLPRLDGARWQARGRQNGRCASGPWALVEPRDNAVDIDGGGDRDVLQVGLRQAPIPRASQPKGAHPLGERPFDAGAPLIALLALLTGIPGLRRVRAPRTGPGAAAAAGGPCAWHWVQHGPRGTRPDSPACRNATMMEGLPWPLHVLPPRHRQLALGTAHLLLLPVHRELLERIGALRPASASPGSGASGPAG